MENQKQLEERLQKLVQLQIRDNTINQYLSINTYINGNRIYRKKGTILIINKKHLSNYQKYNKNR